MLTAVPWCHQISALKQIWDLWDAAEGPVHLQSSSTSFAEVGKSSSVCMEVDKGPGVGDVGLQSLLPGEGGCSEELLGLLGVW